jgi:type IX secretion system PorP/SprF family membrane protein
MVKRCIILLMLFVQIKITAQQMPSYSQYMDNIFILNPAAAGAYGITTMNLSTRQQWLGIDGAPRANTFSVEGRILKKKWLLKKTLGLFGGGSKYAGETNGRVGQGAMVFTDRNGLIRRTGFQYSYAYHVFVGETQFSGGLSAQIYQMGLNKADAVGGNEYDPLLFNNGNIWVPDFNTGLFVTHHALYAGISANSLMQSAMKFGNKDLKDYHLKRYYYIVAGYTIYADRLTIEPSILFKTTGRLGNQLDFSTRITYAKAFWLGASVRTNGDVVALLGVRVKDIYVGYAFDYATTTFKLNSFGTHEISISYKIGSTERRYKWMERY